MNFFPFVLGSCFVHSHTMAGFRNVFFGRKVPEKTVLIVNFRKKFLEPVLYSSFRKLKIYWGLSTSSFIFLKAMSL